MRRCPIIIIVLNPISFYLQSYSVPTAPVSPQIRAQIGSLISSANDLLRTQDNYQSLPGPTMNLIDQLMSSTQQIAQSEPNSPMAREKVIFRRGNLATLIVQ